MVLPRQTPKNKGSALGGGRGFYSKTVGVKRTQVLSLSEPPALLFPVALFQVLSQSVSLQTKKYCQRHPGLALHRNESI